MTEANDNIEVTIGSDCVFNDLKIDCLRPNCIICEPKPNRLKAEWKPFPETAPKNREFLLRGKWLPFDILAGGEECIVIASWSSLMSNDSGFDWFCGLSKLDRINAKFTEWTDLPE